MASNSTRPSSPVVREYCCGAATVLPYCLCVEPLDEAILRHYEGAQEELRITSGLGQLELFRTQEVLRRHLPAPPARILDVGGGTGVHASWLADDGYEVRIVDASQRHVDVSTASSDRRAWLPNGATPTP